MWVYIWEKHINGGRVEIEPIYRNRCFVSCRLLFPTAMPNCAPSRDNILRMQSRTYTNHFGVRQRLPFGFDTTIPCLESLKVVWVSTWMWVNIPCPFISLTRDILFAGHVQKQDILQIQPRPTDPHDFPMAFPSYSSGNLIKTPIKKRPNNGRSTPVFWPVWSSSFAWAKTLKPIIGPAPCLPPGHASRRRHCEGFFYSKTINWPCSVATLII